MELSGQTALVTGAGKRIGRGIALELAKNGVSLVLHYGQSAQEAEETAHMVRQLGVDAAVEGCDLSHPDETQKWSQKIWQKYPISLLVNNAAHYPKSTYKTIDSNMLQASMDLLFLSPLMLIKQLHASTESAAVVNVLDTRMANQDFQHVAYHMGKRALWKATKDLAWELAPKTRVNGVAPGVILAPPGANQDWESRMAGTNPLGRIGEVQEVASAVCYLLSAAFTTGQIVYVDGGRHLKGAES
ncbi:MAG: SDR family oxidoreductase [Spirochaetales bacterium]|nr:SDR family oxidoreductase [Spirochaetales bacterium]